MDRKHAGVELALRWRDVHGRDSLSHPSSVEFPAGDLHEWGGDSEIMMGLRASQSVATQQSTSS